MTRLRARLFALALAGWAGFANAVALGEIEVTSHLNQALVATIPVTTNKPGEMEGATVELANNEEFERAGMERSEFLSALRFEVRDGYIKITSKGIVRDPFVSFLLDVRWIGGHLLREYTVLLDPPSTTAASPPPKAVVVPQATPAATPESNEAPAASTSPAQPQKEPAESPPAPAVASAPAPMAGTGGTYGPISPKETLWSIAYKLRPNASLTMDQVQVALFNANPQAFDHGRLGGLMKGVTLRVPTAQEIRAVNPVAAKAMVANARSGGSTPATASSKASRNSKPAKTAPMPRAEAAPVEESAVPPPKVAEPAPAPKSEPTGEAAPAAAAQAPPQASVPVPSSVPPPASTLSQAAPEPSPATAPVTAPATAAPAEPAPAVAEAPKPAPKPAAPAPGLMSDLVDRGKGLAGEPWFFPAAAGFVLVILALLGYRKLGELYAKWAYERASRKGAAANAGSMGDTDATQVAGGMAQTEQLDAEEATQMAPLVAATQVMSAQTMQQPLHATAQQTLQQTQIHEPPQATTGGQKVDFDVTGNFANETVQINLDAGDPVSEAEFHRAYGLYDEAALLLKQALQKDPKRIDARVKLAEIYFEAGKANEFVEVAKELKAQLPDAEWQKIALLGTQIAPSNELFAGGATATGTVDLSFDEPSVPAAPARATAPAADAPLEFSLDDVQLDTPAVAEPAAAAPAASTGGLEFDLGGLSFDTPAASAPAAPAPPAEPAASGGELNLSDFDLGTETPASGGEAMDLGGDLTADPNAGGDESSTKLDLARAYIDMGDNDMAKSLLNEVAQQGNPQQKNEAQELLKRVPA